MYEIDYGKSISNNATVIKYEIKMRGDRVYDLYLDGKHVVSRGSREGVIEELKNLMFGNCITDNCK